MDANRAKTGQINALRTRKRPVTHLWVTGLRFISGFRKRGDHVSQLPRWCARGELNRRSTTLSQTRTAVLSVKPGSRCLRFSPVSSQACTPGVHQPMFSCSSSNSREPTVVQPLEESAWRDVLARSDIGRLTASVAVRVRSRSSRCSLRRGPGVGRRRLHRHVECEQGRVNRGRQGLDDRVELGDLLGERGVPGGPGCGTRPWSPARAHRCARCRGGDGRRC